MNRFICITLAAVVAPTFGQFCEKLDVHKVCYGPPSATQCEFFLFLYSRAPLFSYPDSLNSSPNLEGRPWVSKRFRRAWCARMLQVSWYHDACQVLNVAMAARERLTIKRENTPGIIKRVISIRVQKRLNMKDLCATHMRLQTPPPH